MKIIEFREKVSGNESLPVWWTPAADDTPDGSITESYPITKLYSTGDNTSVKLYPSHGGKEILASKILEQNNDAILSISTEDFDSPYNVASVAIHGAPEYADRWIELIA